MNTGENLLMPVLFVGHGSPMNAIEENEFSRQWVALGQSLPTPKAILCISAHWQTAGTFVTATAAPRTIHDFYGFPQELYQIGYPAPGATDFARWTQEIVHKTEVRFDEQWGLDHGTWSVLRRMYPQADIPTFQMSLDYRQPGPYHYELGAELRVLRHQGVLIVGSGNVVHNLQRMRLGVSAYGWAMAFDTWVKERLLAHDHQALAGYERLGELARLAHPTAEHYWPLLYVTALGQQGESLSFYCEQLVAGSISMRVVVIGD
jgi:4,5-DOPA dioxygenase extradiol